MAAARFHSEPRHAVVTIPYRYLSRSFEKEPLAVHLLTRIAIDDRGQDIVEYGVLAAFVSIAAVATIRIIGPLLLPLFALVAAALQ